MQCPKCGSGVRDGSTQCPICFAPLDPNAAQAGPVGLQAPSLGTHAPETEVVAGIPGIDNPSGPRPNYLQQDSPSAGMGSGEVRMSLTGEVIEVPAASPRPTGPSASGPTTMGRPTPPAASPRGRYAGAPTRETASQGSGSGTVVAIVLVLLLLVGGGAGGWWFWQQKQHSPEAAMNKFMTAFKGKDYKTMYQAIDFSGLPEASRTLITEDLFTTQMNLVGAFLTLKDFKVNSSTVNGDTATVNVSATAEVGASAARLSGGKLQAGAQTDSKDFSLVRKNGEWKIDGSKNQNLFTGLGRNGGGGTTSGGG